MKKIKSYHTPRVKLSQKLIFKYIYVIFIALNILLIFYLYNFFNEHVYSAIVADRSLIETQARQSMEDVNINRFNNIIKVVEEKKSH